MWLKQLRTASELVKKYKLSSGLLLLRPIIYISGIFMLTVHYLFIFY